MRATTKEQGFYSQIFKLVLPIVIQNLLSAVYDTLPRISGRRRLSREYPLIPSPCRFRHPMFKNQYRIHSVKSNNTHHQEKTSKITRNTIFILSRFSAASHCFAQPSNALISCHPAQGSFKVVSLASSSTIDHTKNRYSQVEKVSHCDEASVLIQLRSTGGAPCACRYRSSQNTLC